MIASRLFADAVRGLALLIILSLSSSWAQDQITAIVEEKAQDVRFSERMTGDWGGPRATLAEHGVDCVLFHHADYRLYGILDRLVCREDGDSDPIQGLGVFFMGGGMPNDSNLVSLHFVGGLQYTGLLPGRDEDLLGLGVTHVDIGDNARLLSRDINAFSGTDSPILDHEITIELTYRFIVNQWCTVQPDLQWVLHPGGSPATGDALVIGARCRRSSDERITIHETAGSLYVGAEGGSKPGRSQWI